LAFSGKYCYRGPFTFRLRYFFEIILKTACKIEFRVLYCFHAKNRCFQEADFMANDNRRILVNADLLPEVLLKVLEAKRLLAQGKVHNASEAARVAGISRSAFYKYKDGVSFYSDDRTVKIITYSLTLMDEPGILSSVLDQISESGANILTINQNIPVDGVAPVTVSFSTGSLKMPESDLLEALSLLKGVVGCRSLMENP